MDAAAPVGRSIGCGGPLLLVLNLVQQHSHWPFSDFLMHSADGKIDRDGDIKGRKETGAKGAGAVWLDGQKRPRPTLAKKQPSTAAVSVGRWGLRSILCFKGLGKSSKCQGPASLGKMLLRLLLYVYVLK